MAVHDFGVEGGQKLSMDVDRSSHRASIYLPSLDPLESRLVDLPALLIWDIIAVPIAVVIFVSSQLLKKQNEQTLQKCPRTEAVDRAPAPLLYVIFPCSYGLKVFEVRVPFPNPNLSVSGLF